MKANQWFPWVNERDKDWLQMGMRELLGVMEMFYIFIVMIVMYVGSHTCQNSLILIIKMSTSNYLYILCQ